ncbi:helix-turn-helix and ligand-binding sensor domain-containing protein [Flagellimonas allohymeniacidonis]|uniref:helix-turn-helix and ligand-binding sensor domain-containing protein n=1 Tax=Flagellimonas allohymeniacidonis TaxID=2517819 RepID=UPI001F0E4C62|nr:triple tyrosine motif-containing protein [Allomuricauda hymeniacidonis]
MRLLRLFLFFFSFGLCSQELPPIQNFAPSEYKGENQNWAISQSQEKTIFVANNKNLLEFNGAEWTAYPSPNETVIRSVRVIGDKVFTGCYMEFGYWDRNAFGMLEYTSISDQLDIEFIPDEEFWNILDIGDYIIFQSKNRIYIYNTADASVFTIDSINTLPKIFNVGQSIYFQRFNEGIFKIQGGTDILVFADPAILEDEVVGIFQDNDNLLILTRRKGFFKTEGGALVKWDISADNLLSNVNVYSSMRLQDQGFALGTISNGLLLLDPDGTLLYHVKQVNGLQNNTVLSLFEDFDKNVWLGLDNGISYINLKSPFRVYHDSEGFVGSVYDAVVQGETLYLGTNQGLFYKNLENDSGFTQINGTQGQVWSLFVYDDTFFCAHHTGTFVIEGNRAKKIADIPGTWKIGKVEGSPEYLLQGNYDGLYVLENKNGAWGLRNKVEGFDNSARYFEKFDDAIFVNHEYKGVFRMDIDDSMTAAKDIRVDTLLKGSNSSILKFKDELLYASRKGILKYDTAQRKFVKDSILSEIYTRDEFTSGKLITDDRNNYLWVFADTDINYVTSGNLTNTPSINQIPLSANERSGIVGYESVIGLPQEQSYLFGSSSGYITAKIDDFEVDDFQVNLKNIRKTGKNLDEKQQAMVALNADGDFKSNENNFTISYAAAVYNKYLKPEYQFQLQGIYPNWSAWSETSKTTFENLPPGDYTFNVRAKAGDKISENVASYSFKVARPWYISNVFIALYVMGILLTSIVIHNAYKRFYHKRQEKLIEKNERDLALAQAENEKEIIRIKNEQLREDFNTKSKELAASTMSIIRKNELLSKIKELLVVHVKDKDAVKPIINTIDSSLNQRDDWEMFKEAFNNADRKFLKKLKKAHPNLSPNDIRLCAYLRLNLSSKEIAPLLNISARSVEIKRYRLRKKMNLDHDENLVNYILKL